MENRDETIAETMERSELGAPQDPVEVYQRFNDIIAARRRKIRDDAPCKGCGATLAACVAQRGKDPTAPSWFGCCARGTAMVPCSHRQDCRALVVLLDEIEAGHVRTVAEIEAEESARAEKIAARAQRATTPDGTVVRSTVDLLYQGDWWRRQSGEWVRIAEMNPGHRYNTAAMLMRSAHMYAYAIARDAALDAGSYRGGDMAQESLDWIADHAARQAIEDPADVLRETTLYQALTAGLTIHGDGTDPHQKTGRNPETGDPEEKPPPMTQVCKIPACGCSGLEHA